MYKNVFSQALGQGMTYSEILANNVRRMTYVNTHLTHDDVLSRLQRAQLSTRKITEHHKNNTHYIRIYI